MAYSNPPYASDGRNTKGIGEDSLAGELPSAAQRTLDDIADALGLTTSLLRRDTRSELVPGGPVNLMEASTLLQTFILIQDPEVRRRCLAFVQAVAAERSDPAAATTTKPR